MYIFYHIILILALVFQESSNILFFQGIKENTKKSGPVDYRRIIIIGSQSYYQSHTYLFLS